MSDIMPGTFRASYVVFSRARYADQLAGKEYLDEIAIHLEWWDRNAEFFVRFYPDPEYGEAQPWPILECSDEVWGVFMHYATQRVFLALADVAMRKNSGANAPSLDSILASLHKHLDITDATPSKPYSLSKRGLE